MKTTPIVRRIDKAMNGRPMSYQSLLTALWPHRMEGTPWAGGIEGVLQKAMRQHGYRWERRNGTVMVLPRSEG